MNIEIIDIDKVIPYARNPRRNDLAVDKVAASLKEFGWKQPIVVDDEMVIIVGHTRYAAARKLDLTEVPVLVAKDLTPQQVKAYRIADNQVATYSEFDDDLLILELLDLQAAEYDVTQTGFDSKDIAEMLATEDEGLIDEDQVPFITEEPIAQLGQVYLLGNHRVMCGSATDTDDMEILMAGEEAALCWTDPPYNVDYKGGVLAQEERSILNDHQDETSFYHFLYDAFTNTTLNLQEGAAVYIAHASLEAHNFINAMIGAGLTFRQTLIWVKDRFTLSRQDYNWQHEPILYGWKPGAAHKWYGDYKGSTVIDTRPNISNMKKDDLIALLNSIYATTDVIDVPRPSKSELHPTTKPVELIEKCLLNSSTYNDIILDPFGGSGSTLIAAQKHNRRCYMMELDPHYVDVIVRRYEEYTGNKAEVANP